MKKMFVPILAVVLLGVASQPALAQCENPLTATTNMQTLMTTQTKDINSYTQQEINFLDKDLKETATKEVMDRFDQFRDNVLDALNAYAEKLMPEMRDMSKQLSMAEVDQTRQIGSFMDAQLQGETMRRAAALETRVQRESTPSDSACVLDTIGPAQSRGQRIARAVAGGLSHDAQRELGGAAGTAGARGPLAAGAAVYEQYATAFCDPAKGDQGCAQPGPLAGRNNDIAGLLWGDRQTIDLNAPENKLVLEAALRNLAGPLPPPPLSAQAARSAAGVEENLKRRANRARVATIYNGVGQLAGMRVGGTGANTQDMRTGAGTPAASAATDASYSEISQAAQRDRYSDPQYLFQMVNNPAGLVRELGAVNAVRMTQTSDLYKRFEELVWIQGATLGAMLDARLPADAAVDSRSQRR